MLLKLMKAKWKEETVLEGAKGHGNIFRAHSFEQRFPFKKYPLWKHCRICILDIDKPLKAAY